ncbi:MAG: hypothetical protein GF384_07730, partial [Elusimicrobia bacterium]|nr:hypothetical protein [Elusimicrobiota bacterium]
MHIKRARLFFAAIFLVSAWYGWAPRRSRALTPPGLRTIALFQPNHHSPVPDTDFMPLAVVALGGNAFGSGPYEDQIKKLDHMLDAVADLVAAGYRIVVSHGNGPQVGDELIRDELGQMQEVPGLPMYANNAKTQGLMGDMITRRIRKIFHEKNINKNSVSLITHVVIDPHDERSHKPTKPVGPWYT